MLPRIVAALSLVQIASAVPCLLTLQLDDKPSDTSWELRGPLPRPTLIDGVTFNYYSTSNELVKELIDLPPGKYWLMLSDFSDDGIQNGRVEVSADLPSGKVDLIHTDGDFGSGKLLEFDVPVDSTRNNMAGIHAREETRLTDGGVVSHVLN